MTDLSKDEARALSKDELELVSAARHPGLREMKSWELIDLIKRLRDRRDRARGAGDRQRREMRGKTDPSGTMAAAENAGTRSKEHYLGAALARAMEERERREKEEQNMTEKKGESQHDIAQRALDMRKEAEKDAPKHPENTPEADQGMQPNPNEDIAPSGAFEAEGDRVVVERSRKVR